LEFAAVRSALILALGAAVSITSVARGTPSHRPDDPATRLVAALYNPSGLAPETKLEWVSSSIDRTRERGRRSSPQGIGKGWL
jgi:hypothetical protein